MSLDLYSTALVWHGYRGIAKLHGRVVRLDAAPELPGDRVVMIDYRPEIAERRIQRYDEAARDMLPHEVSAADAMLLLLLAS
jgi:hypothetical protein